MTTIRVRLHALYRQLDGLFTDREAWWLFRSAALLETVGWTLLIFGIIYKKLQLPAYDYVLPLAGSTHGVFVVYYVFIVFFTHRSLGWGIWRCLIGEAVNAVPYGALVFELWNARQRRKVNL